MRRLSVVLVSAGLVFVLGFLVGHYGGGGVLVDGLRRSAGNLSNDPAIYAGEIGGPAVDLTIRNVAYSAEDLGSEVWGESFRQSERSIELPVAHTALVLVDVWDLVDAHRTPGLEQAVESTVRDIIHPLVLAARRAGMVVIHAAHRPIGEDGRNEGGFVDFRAPGDASRQELPPVRPRAPGWPPEEFRYRVGKYGQFARFDYPEYLPYPQVRGIHPLMTPLPGDREHIAFRLDEVRSLLAAHGVLHLLYAGFDTNGCVVSRPVGIREMSMIGYNTILLRDATLGKEFAQSMSSRAVTEGAILDVEVNYGFSALAAELTAKLVELADDPAGSS